MRALRAELSKLVTLPFAWLGFIAGLVVPVGITTIASLTIEPGPDTGFSELAVGVLGAIIIGVTAIASEYTSEGEEAAGSRQITATLTTTPSRLRVLAAKTGAVILAVTVLAVVAFTLVLTTAQILLGADAPALDGATMARLGGALVYWVLLAVIALGLTVLTRNGIIPMAILVLNSSAVPFTYLAANSGITAANYLPDLAGMRLFVSVSTGVEIAPIVGGVVMGAWALALLVIAGIVFTRRDA